MILYKLKELECALQFTIIKSKRKVKTINKLKNLFLEVDQKNELIPENSLDDITNLLKLIKGKNLSAKEKEILIEILKE
ncbi:hypothetical protein V8G56_03925 [Gaetbulibacter aquiaggeris]|uniref:Uncharacterized protein n=1 Tax=Gaetbulibacter aquiaggeris TaxID=1735373 RepID=A0ABW7MM31_9FLAO